MTIPADSFEMIVSDEALARMAEANSRIPWLCFDTEFVGERRYYTTLCLVQVLTPVGGYLIDPFEISEWGPFLKILEDEQVEKITHAGENDYRLLHSMFRLVPANTFDTQVAAGFLGYRYPMSFGKILNAELGVSLPKGYAVTDWEARPISKEQLKYAIDDVLYLPDLSEKMRGELDKRERLGWFKEECAEMETSEYYYLDPNREFLKSNLVRNLKKRERLFLARLLAWRQEEARKKNRAKDNILPSKLISHIVKGIASGKGALHANRRIPSHLVKKYGEVFSQLFQQEATEEEKALLAQIPREAMEDPEHDIILEMLHLLVRYKCVQARISPDLVVSRSALNKLKGEPDYFDPRLEEGWRSQFLGPELVNWLRHRHQLQLQFAEGRFELSFE
jgi:ribonuclease D